MRKSYHLRACAATKLVPSLKRERAARNGRFYTRLVPEEPPAPVADLDWSPDRARVFAKRIVDLYAGFLATLPDGPAAPHVTPRFVRAALALAVPDDPLSDDAISAHLQALLDLSTRPGSGGFLAYISGGGTVPGAISDLLASGLNANVGGWAISPAASEIESQLVNWLADRFGFGPDSGGMIVQGGSLANLTGLKLARDHARPSARTDGVGAGPPLAFYTSAEAHFTVDRAADVLGLGEAAVRKVPVDANLRMRVDELERMIVDDLAKGMRPAAVVATAGTTGTGAIDPLAEIAAVAARHDVWFHVDAAYGGAVAVSDTLRPLLAGIELADSITFDAHKWLYAPLTTAFILVRDASHLGGSFSAHAAYVEQERHVLERGSDMGMEGLQLSRSFSALRVWVALLAHGRAAFARRIEHDVELTDWLARRIEETPELELACAPSLSICCFRYRPEGVVDEDYLDRLNMRLMTAIQADGEVFPSNAQVHGRTALRSCIVTYRTEATHLKVLMDKALQIGERLHASGELLTPK
jgi:aromatic-L-amino-acid/L-tryptophan decarboxylase